MSQLNLRIAILLLLAIVSTTWLNLWVVLGLALLAAAISAVLFQVSKARRTEVSASVDVEPFEDWQEWSALTPEEQTTLQIEFGHFLDTLPPTCSMDAKKERFRQWLATEKRVRYSSD
ncbi:hypothetical protein [Reinekea blandensis]|uniref:Uncharacterized protein n=1 Tax=Reinekea blandensis MED297 TaxID=314283 RepID=A4BDI8_9GAMM|nr:hypothetical protein [Reinekea blandensis]EAR09932.1 hypothetical protein MED297_06269 [Reinekea sp. MED297] [Reinekea blandensis MED297]